VIVWQLEGNHSNEWNKAQIPLNTTGLTKFKVTSISTTEISATTLKLTIKTTQPAALLLLQPR
jgi:hypothetical protein